MILNIRSVIKFKSIDPFPTSVRTPVRHCLLSYSEHILKASPASAFSENSDPVTHFVSKQYWQPLLLDRLLKRVYWLDRYCTNYFTRTCNVTVGFVYITFRCPSEVRQPVTNWESRCSSPQRIASLACTSYFKAWDWRTNKRACGWNACSQFLEVRAFLCACTFCYLA